MTSKATLLTRIAALFPFTSMANPTRSDINTVLTDMLDYDGEPTVREITATVDGLTTGLIVPTDEWLDVIAGGDANAIITLPALSEVSNGKTFEGYIGATGCELRTPANSGEKINNVDSDGTQEAAIPATTYFWVKKISDSVGWLLVAETELGARIAAIVPD